MLTDADYRRRIVAKVCDPFVRAFWSDEFENDDARFQREAIAPIQNKHDQFLSNPVVRNNPRASAKSSPKCANATPAEPV